MGRSARELKNEIEGIFDTFKKQLAAQEVLTNRSSSWAGVQKTFDQLRAVADASARTGIAAEADLDTLQKETTPLIETLHAEAEESARSVTQLTDELNRVQKDLKKTKKDLTSAQREVEHARANEEELQNRLKKMEQMHEEELKRVREQASTREQELLEELETTSDALDLAESDCKEIQKKSSKDIHDAKEQVRKHVEEGKQHAQKAQDCLNDLRDLEKTTDAELANRAAEITRLRDTLSEREREVQQLQAWQSWARELGGEELRKEASQREDLQKELTKVQSDAANSKQEMRAVQQSVWIKDKRIAQLEVKLKALARERERMQKEVAAAREAAAQSSREAVAATLEATRMEGRMEVDAVKEHQRHERYKKEVEVKDAIARGWEREVQYLQEKLAKAEAQVRNVTRQAITKEAQLTEPTKSMTPLQAQLETISTPRRTARAT